jgi:hypothetical protein
MAYQNINQYNFRRWGLKPVNEITDLCLASDEKDYDQEVIFSPLLIAEDDGNRMPFSFNFNNTGTTICAVSGCSFSSDTIVSENYWNPLDIDPNFCPVVTELCDIGLTGIDNGLVPNMSGETIEITTGLYTSVQDRFSRYKYDRRMKMHPITGFTTSENRLWNDDSYTYDLSYVNAGGDIGYVAQLNGGFYQGFYKIAGYDYQVFPERVSLGWTAEFMLKYRWTGDTSVGLNNRYPDNKGTFFYMGARAENKFYHYADGSPAQDTGYTRVTSGLTCMHTCGCSSSANTASTCLSVYQISGGTSTNCSCGCNCQCSVTAKYPESDPLYDEVSNALSLRLSGDTGNPKLCVKVFRITGGCETSGTCLTGLTYTTGTSVTEWCSTRGIFDFCSGTTYPNVEHWVQIDAVFQRNEWLDTCDLYDKGGLGLIVSTVFTATSANNSISLIEPPLTHEQPYDPETTEVVKFNDMWTEEIYYRLGTLKFYVNGRLFMVAENFEEIIPRLLNTERENQIGVGYNISLGGGTQGLHDNLTFSGGCPPDLSGISYQQDPECLTTYDLDHTIYSGLTTQIQLETLFGGSMIGEISAFRMYTEPLNAAQIKHNFKILENKYDLLNPDCLDCRIAIPANDLYYEVIEASPTPTPTLTPTPTSTPIPIYVPTCSLIFNSDTGGIYSYNSSGNTSTFLYDSGIVSGDIANTLNKLWVYSSVIYEYDITLSPWSITFNRVISLSVTLGSGLGAINDTTLISTDFDTSEIITLDITTSAATKTVIGSLPSGRVVSGDILQTTTTPPKILVTNEGGGYFLTQYVVVGGLAVFETEVNIGAYSTVAWGLYEDNSELYFVNGYGGQIFNVDLYPPYNITATSGNTSYTVYGASQVPSCLNVSLILTTPTPTPTNTETPTPTPTITPTN